MSIEAIATKAAKWWADMMRMGLANGDNGDHSSTGFATRAMVLSALARSGVDRDQLADKFENTLQRMIVSVFERGQEDAAFWPGYHRGARLQLAVDYHPEGLLRAALLEAGVPDVGAYNTMIALPWKTTMFVFEDHIDLKAGYSAPWMTLVAADVPPEGSPATGGNTGGRL